MTFIGSLGHPFMKCNFYQRKEEEIAHSLRFHHHHHHLPYIPPDSMTTIISSEPFFYPSPQPPILFFRPPRGSKKRKDWNDPTEKVIKTFFYFILLWGELAISAFLSFLQHISNNKMYSTVRCNFFRQTKKVVDRNKV